MIMTTELRCDRRGCPKTAAIVGRDLTGLQRSLDLATQVGWAVTDTDQLCPTHNEETPDA